MKKKSSKTRLALIGVFTGCLVVALLAYYQKRESGIIVDSEIHDVGDYRVIRVDGEMVGVQSARSDKSSIRWGRFVDGTIPKIGEILPLKIQFQRSDPNNNCAFLVFKTE